MRKVFFVALISLHVSPHVPLLAHTLAETNAVIRGALGNFVCYSARGIGDLPRRVSPTEVPSTWSGFLGGHLNDGWTLEEKKAAFDWYLGTLGTNDCVALSGWDKGLVRAALVQCKSLHHTNCVPAMKALALNPRGIQRQRALTLAIEFGNIDEDMVVFVESIMTNSASYTIEERGVAVGKFSSKLLASNATNSVDAVRMLYHHRQLGLAGVNMLDNLFSARIGGYAMSSNRLEFANFVLGHPDARDFNIRKFTSVTNQLLSSGQPLVQLTIGEGD